MVKQANKLNKKALYRLGLLILLFTSQISLAQVSLTNDNKGVSYNIPKNYTVGGIDIEGTKFLDHKTLIQLSGIEVGDNISEVINYVCGI